MSDATKQKELYIADIRWKTHFKRIFFEGSATEQAARAFEGLSEKLGEMAQSAISWEAMLAAVRVQYEKAGFIEIQP